MKPWHKRGGWPYEGPRGRSWQLGFRDHEGRTRSRHFATKDEANDWIREYRHAERRGRLGAFLDGALVEHVASSAAGMTLVPPDEPPLIDLIVDWLTRNAHPNTRRGLAPSTYQSYAQLAQRHILGLPTHRRTKTGPVLLSPPVPPLGTYGGYAIGHCPISSFQTGKLALRWWRAMQEAGVPQSSADRAWAVLSSALSWAAGDEAWDLSANGLLGVNRHQGNNRRSARRQGTGQAASRKARVDLAGWALSPTAAELIRLVQRERHSKNALDPRSPGAGRPSILAYRDGAFVAIQFGLATRDQETWGFLIGDLLGDVASFRQVVSSGDLDEGKTQSATDRERRPPIDRLLRDDLDTWFGDLDAGGYHVDPQAFALPGDLAGHGKDGHVSENQASKWGSRYFTPAVNTVVRRWPEFRDIVGATPYSLRRGMISLRIRAGDDLQVIAKECGTSVQMLFEHYSFVLTHLEGTGPRDWREERRRAREEALWLYREWS